VRCRRLRRWPWTDPACSSVVDLPRGRRPLTTDDRVDWTSQSV